MNNPEADEMLHSMVGMALLPESTNYTATAYSVIRRLLWSVPNVRIAIAERRYDDAEDEIRRLLADRSQLQAAS